VIRPARDIETAELFVPANFRSLRVLREAAAGCRGCDLYKQATQTVFGEGDAHAPLMLIGEVPGDQEDQQGHPFVGPAGRVLNRAMQEAGLDRRHAFVTNAVKHFKYTLRGKRRLHKKPNAAEVRACRPWLEAEVALVKPRVLIALGATAAQSLFGRDFRLTHHRGEIFESEWAGHCMATIHPSAILRVPPEVDREETFRSLVGDLSIAAQTLAGPTPRASR
jgi:uracil-DNA glycosylase